MFPENATGFECVKIFFTERLSEKKKREKMQLKQVNRTGLIDMAK